MVFEIIIKPIVFLDVEEAVIYYNKKLNGLGNRFYNHFLTSLNQIEINPHHYSYIKDPVRRHIIEKFPYKVYYIITADKIIVIGVSHTKRSNACIKRRLKLLE